MKILLVNKYLYPRGGAERVFFDTATVLKRVGHDVAFFGMEHPQAPKGAFTTEAITYNHPSWQAIAGAVYNKQARKDFAQALAAFRPDIVHFHNIYHQLSFSLFDEIRSRNIPSVLTMHDYKMLSPNYRLYHHGHIDTSMLGKKYYRCMLGNCMEYGVYSAVATVEAYVRSWKRYADVPQQYISPSKFLARLCVQAGWDKERVSVIPNPVDTSSLSFYEPNQSQEGVGYIGRFTDEKGIHTLIEAAMQLPNISFSLIGEGPMRQDIEQFVKKHKLHNIELVGWKSGSALKKLRSQLRLIVVPSEWYENCPMSMLEAMAGGTLVVASNIGGIPELLPPQLLHKPGDARDLAKLIQLWYDAPIYERRDVGEVLRKKVEEVHSFATYGKQLTTCYQTILS